MMMKEHTTNETNIHFRLTRLDKFQAFTLVREILGSTYLETQQANQYIGYIPLTEANFDDINDYVVRQRVHIDECDIFISVSISEQGTDIDIPNIVNRMLKYIDCKLTFSVTTVAT